MRKELQIMENERVLKALNDFKSTSTSGLFTEERLYNCTARVIDNNDKYLVLMSYSTVIAIMDKTSGIIYDFLRLVYGYTATSAQHVSKFAKKYDASKVLHYKEV